MTDPMKKTRRQKIKEWFDAHPDAPAAIAVGFVATAVTAVYVSESRKLSARTEQTTEAIKSLTERRDKTNELITKAESEGNVVHSLYDGRALIIPANTPQKTHLV